MVSLEDILHKVEGYHPAADLSPLAAAARQAGLREPEITRTLDSARNGGRTRTPAPDHQAEAGEV